MLHNQIHSAGSPVFSRVDKFPRKQVIGTKEIDVSYNINVDQFFSQKHNLRNGFVSTNPLLADSPDSIGHFGFTADSPGFPSDTPDSEIHSTVVSKHCQSLSQVQQLKKLRPVESSFLDDEPAPQPVPEPAPEPAPVAGDS